MENEPPLKEVAKIHTRKVCGVSVVQRYVAQHLPRRPSYFALRRVRHHVAQVVVDALPHARGKVVRRRRSRAHQCVKEGQRKPPERMKCRPIEEELEHGPKFTGAYSA